MVGRTGIPPCKVCYIASGELRRRNHRSDSRYAGGLPLHSPAGAIRVESHPQAHGARYTREFYLDRVRKLREVLPDLTISTDIIAGFPAKPQKTSSRPCRFTAKSATTRLICSSTRKREGTPAAIHFEDVPRAVKTERLGRLVDLQKQLSLEQNHQWVGREVEVLIKGAAEEAGFGQGHTRGNHVILIKAISRGHPSRAGRSRNSQSPVRRISDAGGRESRTGACQARIENHFPAAGLIAGFGSRFLQPPD